MQLRQLSTAVSVAPQLFAEELAEVARLGFRTVINNRPDGEAIDQPPSSMMEETARGLGLVYHHQPVVSGAITLEDVLAFRELLAGAAGPVLAFCRSGTRCTQLWALAQAGECDAETVIRAAAAVGYDIRALREILERGLPG